MARKSLLVMNALFSSAVFASLGGSLVYFAIGSLQTGAALPWEALSYILTCMFLVVLAVNSTAGLAWHSFASRRAWRDVHFYWLPGAGAGCLVGLAIVSAFFVAKSSRHISNAGAQTDDAGLFIANMALVGGLAGLVAWLIRRPDRDANPVKPAP